MRHFTTAKAQCDLNFIAFFEKTLEISQFNLVIAGIGSRSEFYFLDLNLLLFFLRRLLFFRLIKLPLTKIHHPANRRIGVGVELHDIQFNAFGPLDGVLGRDDADLLSVLINQTYVWYLYFFINAPIFTGAGLLTSRPRLSAYSDASFLQKRSA